MKLIKSYYEISSDINGMQMIKFIEKIGRTCYKSEDHITKDSAEKFIKMIIDNGHESVLEHEKITVRIICDRGVSHELVRHRIASYSQESTRFCNYSKDNFGNQLTFILPLWCSDELLGDWDREGVRNIAHIWGPNDYKLTLEDQVFIEQLFNSESSYLFLIERGWTPQQARSILPTALKTEIVITANLREWRLIFKQRTAKAAHPQMREIMIPLLKDFQRRIPVIYADIKI